MATAYDENDWTMESLVKHYETVIQYLKWKDSGKVLACGCGMRSDIENSKYPALAYQLGKNL